MYRGERRINAKSIMGVMMLAAGMGDPVDVETHGERRARGHGCAAGVDQRQVWRGRVTFSRFMDWRLRERIAIAIGRAVLVASSRLDVAHYFIEPSQVAAEINRVRDGRDAVVKEIHRLQASIAQMGPKDTPHELDRAAGRTPHAAAGRGTQTWCQTLDS
jgi:hypothetical protein